MSQREDCGGDCGSCARCAHGLRQEAEYQHEYERHCEDQMEQQQRQLTERLVAALGGCRDSDGFCLACNSWTEHESDCAFIAARGAP